MKKLLGKENLTIPNLLSVFRIFLAFVFCCFYQKESLNNRSLFLAGILGLSALTDMLDGKIARRFHMVSELGKILDPVADKITQAALLICLVKAYPSIKYVLFLFLIKEVYMAVGGAIVITRSGKNDGAKWYGKVSTAVFYTVMIILILFPAIPRQAANILIAVSGGCMCMAFILYVRDYRNILKVVREQQA